MPSINKIIFNDVLNHYMDFRVKTPARMKKLMWKYVYQPQKIKNKNTYRLYPKFPKGYKKMKIKEKEYLSRAELLNVFPKRTIPQFKTRVAMLQDKTIRRNKKGESVTEDVLEELLRREITIQMDENFWMRGQKYIKKVGLPPKKKPRKTRSDKKKRTMRFAVAGIIKIHKPFGNYDRTPLFHKKIKHLKELIRENKALFKTSYPYHPTQFDLRDFINDVWLTHRINDSLFYEWLERVKQKRLMKNK